MEICLCRLNYNPPFGCRTKRSADATEIMPTNALKWSEIGEEGAARSVWESCKKPWGRKGLWGLVNRGRDAKKAVRCTPKRKTTCLNRIMGVSAVLKAATAQKRVGV